MDVSALVLVCDCTYFFSTSPGTYAVSCRSGTTPDPAPLKVKFCNGWYALLLIEKVDMAGGAYYEMLVICSPSHPHCKTRFTHMSQSDLATPKERTRYRTP